MNQKLWQRQKGSGNLLKRESRTAVEQKGIEKANEIGHKIREMLERSDVPFINIDASISFWLALITASSGFGSGVVRNIQQGTVNWYMVKQYLIPTIPAVIIGSLLSAYVNGNILILIFSSFILMYGVYQLIASITSRKEQPKHRKIYREVGFIAGFLKGLIATGLGKLITPGMWNHERMRTVIINVLVFVVPSVVIGGQIGPRIIRNADANRLKIYISVLLILVSMLIFSRGLLL